MPLRGSRWALLPRMRTPSQGDVMKTFEKPAELTTAIKRLFKSRGLKVRAGSTPGVRHWRDRYFSAVIPGAYADQALEKPIPNDIRRRSVELTYGRPIEECKVHDLENISYGNTMSNMVSMLGRHWETLLNEVSS